MYRLVLPPHPCVTSPTLWQNPAARPATKTKDGIAFSQPVRDAIEDCQMGLSCQTFHSCMVYVSLPLLEADTGAESNAVHVVAEQVVCHRPCTRFWASCVIVIYLPGIHFNIIIKLPFQSSKWSFFFLGSSTLKLLYEFPSAFWVPNFTVVTILNNINYEVGR
jgi:hypothetical protein